MKYKLTELPYAKDALEPKMSKTTLEYHHEKHHAAYVANLNKLVEGTDSEGVALERLICETTGAIFNNAAQAWNHSFFFEQFSAKPQQAPTGALLESIELSFGSFGSFKEQFSQAALSLFGSGWVWLAKDGKDELIISPMANAENPLRSGHTPILTCDVWEHAYYIDHFNNRAAYLENFWELVDWSVIEKRFKS